MFDVSPPGYRPKTPTDLVRAREAIAWVDEDDLETVERRSPAAAALFGFLSWGGGRLVARDFKKGLAAIGALFGWVMLSELLVDPLGPLVWSTVGVFAAFWSRRGVRALNRYVAIREALQLQAGAAAVARQLPAPPAAALVPAHAELIDRLRKLAALHGSAVLDDTELRDRKVDLLTAAAPASRADLDELLYALLPLGDEGILDAEDFEFLKQVGGDR